MRAAGGVVERVHGGFVFPDSNAHGQGENPQWCYTRALRPAPNCGGRAPTLRSSSHRLLGALSGACVVTGDVAGALTRTAARSRRTGGAWSSGSRGKRRRLPRRVAAWRGLFTWAEWADALAAEIRAAHAAGDPDTGETYYVHWLAALERLVVRKGAATTQALDERRDAWDRAARATPHGLPITLDADPARHGTRD